MAEQEILGTDLFGDPVLPRREGRGRPEVVWDRATSNRALVAFARGLSVAKAAKVCGLSTPTFRKVYFSECAKRKDADLRLEMTMLAKLAEKGEGGDTGAIKELFKQLDRVRSRDLAERLPRDRAAKSKPKGKKEEQQDAANKVGGRFGTRSPPPGLQMN